MALSDPRIIFGVHSFTPYRRSDGTFYGTLKVLKGSNLSLEGTPVEQMGGASKFAWAVEDGEIKVELSLKVGQFENFLFELFLGKAPTLNAAETGASVTALRAISGTTLNSAVTGLAAIAVKAAAKADVKFARYIAVAFSATQIDVYLASDVDGGRGTALPYQTDALKVTVTPLTITNGGAIDIPGTGLTITGGSAVAMTPGDSVAFQSRPVNSKSTDVVIGSSANQIMPEFGAIVLAQKRGNQEMTEIDCYRCKGSGMPLGFDPNNFAEAEVKVKAFYDSNRDGVFSFRHVTPA